MIGEEACMPNWEKDTALAGNEKIEDLAAAEAAEKMDRVLEMQRTTDLSCAACSGWFG